MQHFPLKMLHLVFERAPRLKGMDGRNYVEPDVLIMFADSLLLVEVKPPFGGNQYENQWIAQIESLILQRNFDDPAIHLTNKFHFLALGKNSYESHIVAEKLVQTYADEGLVSFHRHEWYEICQGVRRYAESEQGRDRIIYNDWMDAFELFGLIEQPLPFSDLMMLDQLLNSDYQKLIQLFPIQKTIDEPVSICWTDLNMLLNRIELKEFIWN